MARILSVGPQEANATAGEQGEPGETGPQGTQGEQGEVGPTGPEGVQGIQGIQGEGGLVGPAGLQGQTGTPGNIQFAWPIGSIFITVLPTNPSIQLGFGTWIAFAAGRVLVGLDVTQVEFDTVEETSGSKTHTLTTPELPAHTHIQDSHVHLEKLQGGTTGTTTGTHLMGSAAVGGVLRNSAQSVNASTAVNQNAGGGAAHNNLQPYIIVHMFKRTA